MTSPSRSLRVLIAVLALALVAAACGDDDSDGAATDSSDQVDDNGSGSPDEPAAIEGDLVGVFEIDAGDCADGTVTSGSYFRMVNPGGTLEDGEFVRNGDSTCADPTWNALVPGTAGGLDTGSVQAAPDPAFDATGNGLAADIIEPVTFFGVAFAVGTEEPAPVLVATDGVISGDIASWTAFYGNEEFNQGSPKPDGSAPGLTAGPTGTIDPETGVYVIDWSSQIVGGAFNDFTGVWHIEGTFVPA